MPRFRLYLALLQAFACGFCTALAVVMSERGWTHLVALQAAIVAVNAVLLVLNLRHIERATRDNEQLELT